ncbi:MAG: fumarylacetoacetate hydrolase family protein [Bacillaceae bacterium]|nr:fumarylacetoacetate hydrolase family protein [Bacillaceae bacterium]
MRFVTYQINKKQGAGVLDPSRQVVIDLGIQDLLQGIEQGDDFVRKAQSLLQQNGDGAATYPLDEVKLLAPIPRPRKNIFCLGKNYAEHAIEMGGAESIPKHPMVFSKAPTSVIAHEDEVLYDPEVTQEVDYEGELALVIGKKGRKISRDNAFDYIFGYTIINDVTARDLQQRHKQFLLGKSLDTFCPMGPWLVHKSELIDTSDLKIETKVNGEVRQSSSTRHFIFDIPEIIATISAGITLEPGDIISTGTPAGVGKGFNPPKLLKDGDVVEITVEGVGTLRNRVSVHTSS